MKTRIFTLCLSALFIGNFSFATIRRIGYFGTPISGVDFTTFTDAYNAAAAGDTFLVFPGINIGSPQIAKKLIIIGTGNWLDPNSTPKGNANQQAHPGSPMASSVYFLSGSAGSEIMGFDFQNTTVYPGDDNIIIRRNRNVNVNIAYNPNSPGTPITLNNLQLIENYRLGVNSTYYGSTVTNINVSNNFMNYFSLYANNNYGGNISNNVWAGQYTPQEESGGTEVLSAYTTSIGLGGGSFLFQSNILLSDATPQYGNQNYNWFTFQDGSNTVYNYNVYSAGINQNSTGGGTGNVIVPVSDIPNVFVAFPNIGTSSADARYMLKANSPASQANRPGSPSDAGMFAGPAPYKLSTLPPIPSIYSISSPQGNNPSGSTIQINLSTKANN